MPCNNYIMSALVFINFYYDIIDDRFTEVSIFYNQKIYVDMYGVLRPKEK